MKLTFIYYDRPNYFGGPIVNARRLLPELVRRGHEVHCLMFYSGDHAPSVEYLERHGVSCSLRKLGGYTEDAVIWILRRVAELLPDVFVPNLSVAGWYAAKWVREAGIPTVAAHRSSDAFHWAMVDEFVNGAPEWAVSSLVCVSEAIRQRVLRNLKTPMELRVIPSGVPVGEHVSDQSGPLRLVYVGRLVQTQKRILDVVDAMARCIRSHPELTGTLIGDGPEAGRVEDRIGELGMRGRIEVMGVVENDGIQAELARHHVLVLLSDYEGTPGAVMDGMAAGLVPVVLDIPGGPRELVTHGETGLLVGDREDGFAEAISRLRADEPLRRRLARNARERVRTSYSLEVAADRWERLFADLVSSGTVRGPLEIPSRPVLPPMREEFRREDRRKGLLQRKSVRAILRKLSRRAG